jgi:hypothetical protein
MIKFILKLLALLAILAILYELLFPSKEPEEPPPLPSRPYHNFWLDAQQEKDRKRVDTFRVEGDYLDDPSEAWHEADEAGDSDDPEIYNDVYDR